MSKEIESRFAFIERVSWWEGRVNAAHISKQYGLSRQAASGVLKQYREQYPQNLNYDASVKGHVPTLQFKARSGNIHFSYYLYTISNSSLGIVSDTNLSIHEIETPLRNINPNQVRPILRAIREKLSIDIGYISLSSPDYLDRIIQPHALIFDGLRWHVRAFCFKNQAFRDFSLSRFNGQAVIESKAHIPVEQDLKWQTILDVIIEPDPRLNNRQKQVIETDYQMRNGQYIIKTRAALVNYLLLRLRLDSYKNTPEEQQIVLTQESRKSITSYLL